MKNFIALILFVVLSCAKETKSPTIENSGVPEKIKIPIEKKAQSIENTAWFKYYKELNPTFQSALFKLQQSSPIDYQESSVPKINEKEFDKIYEPFLIFNKDKEKYLDFDSYHWSQGANKRINFEADQNVVLVDLKKNKSQQIAFFGPSYQIEDVFWKGDSIAVLLGNSYEKVPFIMEYNFVKNIVKNYQYPDTLKFETPYSKIRFRNKGLKID